MSRNRSQVLSAPSLSETRGEPAQIAEEDRHLIDPPFQHFFVALEFPDQVGREELLELYPRPLGHRPRQVGPHGRRQ